MSNADKTPLPPLEEILAGDAFRDTLIKHADAYAGSAPMWHGWAIMDAFLAGVAWQKGRDKQ